MDYPLSFIWFLYFNHPGRRSKQNYGETGIREKPVCRFKIFLQKVYVLNPGIYYQNRGFTAEQLYSTASYQSGDLSRIALGEYYRRGNDLSGWNFAGQNLTDAWFCQATLTDADFSGAVVNGAHFANTTSQGFTAQQLYSTASYQTADLSRISLGYNDLSGWDFAGQNLAQARFNYADLTDDDFSGANLAGAYMGFADLRGAIVLDSQVASAASTGGTILPDGRIEGLSLDADERLTVRDYNGETTLPITIESTMDLDLVAALRMVFEDGDWGSTISFQPGIDVALGGSLELMFADNTNPAALIGPTFDLFDWDGVNRAGEFDRIVTEWEAVWDTTELYTTGEVTLLWAVPEPSTLVLLGAGAVVLLAGVVLPYRRRRPC